MTASETEHDPTAPHAPFATADTLGRRWNSEAIYVDPGGELQPNLGRFALIDKIGEGGMGSVYAAFDRRLDRKVAIKVLRQNVATEVTIRARMLREAQAMARLSHPNVIPVFEVGEYASQIYVAMEYVDGPTLYQWQAGKPWQDILAMYLKAGRGLCAAHHSGLIHRDFKAHNVLIGQDGRPRVIDFGLARLGDVPPTDPKSSSSLRTDQHISLNAEATYAGALVGTPAYMSPEQVLGDEVGSAGDQFAFCAALFEALYGEFPFVRTTMSTLLESLEAKPPPPPPDSHVPEAIYPALVRGLARHPADRWHSLEQLLHELGKNPAQDPATGWRTRLGLALAVMVILLITWPLIDHIAGDVEHATAADSLVVAVAAALPLLMFFWLARRAIARSELTTKLVGWSTVTIVALIFHRLTGWLADVSPTTTLISDHVVLGTGAALAAFWVGWWVALIACAYFLGALVSAVLPAWSGASFACCSLVGLLITVVASLRLRKRF